MDADQIIVLEEGRIAGIGTHRELMRSNEVYREIVSSQLSLEEIDLIPTGNGLRPSSAQPVGEVVIAEEIA